MIYEEVSRNVRIEADYIFLGEPVYLGKNISIKVRGQFLLGNYSRLGDDVNITGNNVIIGQHLYHSFGLRVGGGGSNGPDSNLYIGDRCTIHNNFINICKPVVIGNDVGLSEDVTLMTHGYWLSALDGYPAKFEGIKIGNGVIIGYRSLIMMGVEIAENTVMGAQSVVTKSIRLEGGVWAGSPVEFKGFVTPPTKDQKIQKLNDIINGYMHIAEYHGVIARIYIEYPLVCFGHPEFTINVETFEYNGNENEDTDDFRDYMRKWGIRIYTRRPFASKRI
jgi:acetyltransferase-like isoleucine patch superfamily enzyme